MTPSVHLLDRTVFVQSVLVMFMLAARPAGATADPRGAGSQDKAAFGRLLPLATPRIVAASEGYPGGAYKAAHLTDGNLWTEYSSKGDGTNTFVEFDFGAPTQIAGFRHQDRNNARGHRSVTCPGTRGAPSLRWRTPV